MHFLLRSVPAMCNIKSVYKQIVFKQVEKNVIANFKWIGEDL